MTYTIYEQIKFWLPIISAFGIITKAYFGAKKNVTEFADKLLTNHLTHIEQATVSTEAETKKTNVLLTESSGKLDTIQSQLSEQHSQQILAWQGIIESLAVLKERTRGSRKPHPKR